MPRGGPPARAAIAGWDLGAHAAVTANMIGVTLNARMGRAAACLPAVKGLPMGKWLLQRVLLQKYLQMAVYGAEVSPPRKGPCKP